MAQLKAELAGMGQERGTQRARRREREGLARVALVGYTNAGKSTLMRALTGSEVLVANKLFATLDTTVRALHPESVPRVLVRSTANDSSPSARLSDNTCTVSVAERAPAATANVLLADL